MRRARVQAAKDPTVVGFQREKVTEEPLDEGQKMFRGSPFRKGNPFGKRRAMFLKGALRKKAVAQ